VPLSADDRAAITELLALHGHLFDDGELDRLDALFVPSVSYDVTALETRAVEPVNPAPLPRNGERGR